MEEFDKFVGEKIAVTEEVSIQYLDFLDKEMTTASHFVSPIDPVINEITSTANEMGYIVRINLPSSGHDAMFDDHRLGIYIIKQNGDFIIDKIVIG